MILTIRAESRNRPFQKVFHIAKPGYSQYLFHGNGVCRPAWENRLTNSALMTPTNK
jgi:hypothetical protein